MKIRGFRIELGEIESALFKHPDVNECVVLAREDAPGLRRLVAYLSTSEGTSVTAAQLRDFLKQSLPEFMLPSAFVCLPSLPLTPNGKVDRKALPSPDSSLSESDSYVAPGSPVEEVVAELMAEVLDIPRVGINDDFFALGGHSLLATRFISLIHEILQVSVPLRTLFQNPTVATFAEAMLQPPADKEEIIRTAEQVLALSDQPDDEPQD